MRGSSKPMDLEFKVASCINLSLCTSLFRSIWLPYMIMDTSVAGFDYCGMRWILLHIYCCVGTFIAYRTLEALHDVYCFG
jgi:hypothetical protein